MSKRDEGGKPATIQRLKEDGYLPEAVVNFLALLGWNPGQGSEKEFFSVEELIKEFDFKHVAKAGAIFDLERLNFFNAHYLRKLSPSELAEKIKPFLSFEIDDEEVLEKAVKLASERMRFFGEANEFLHYFFGELTYEVTLFENPKMKVDLEKARNSLEAALPILEKIENWKEEEIQKQLFAIIEKLAMKNGEMLWPLRVALTGEKFSPGVWEMCGVLGKEKSLERIRKALDKLKN